VQRPINYERVAARYDSGRSLPLEWIDAWRVVLTPYLSELRRPILDVGAGTGLWCEAFTTWFDARVIGIEPSDAMRREAAKKGLGSQVALLGGTAEDLPLRDGSCNSTWLSTVIHHVPDLRACAAELRRVVRNGGAVLIRNSFGDRLEGIHWLQFFPAAKQLATRRWPTVEATAQAFRTAGFRIESLHRVPEVVAGSLEAYHQRVSIRANSTLTLISDEDFLEGLARLKDAAGRETGPEPVVDHRDLLVLR
jgi:SAM-dependent methyltransferase